MYLDPEKEKMLAETANTIRQDIISMLLAAKSRISILRNVILQCGEVFPISAYIFLRFSAVRQAMRQ